MRSLREKNDEKISRKNNAKREHMYCVDGQARNLIR